MIRISAETEVIVCECLVIAAIFLAVRIMRAKPDPADWIMAVASAVGVMSACLLILQRWYLTADAQWAFLLLICAWQVRRGGRKNRRKAARVIGEKSRAVLRKLTDTVRGLGRRRVLVPRPVVGFDPGLGRG